jgi:iron complex outermembrane receptor protein
VDYKDRISGLPAANTALSSPERFALYEPFFIRAPQPASCVNGSQPGLPGAPEYATYNPAYLPYLNVQGFFPATTANDCQLIGILRSETRNLGQVQQSGLDFTVSYRADLGFAELSVNGGFNKILKLKRNVLPGTPLVDALDVIGEQIGERGRLQAGLRRGPLSGNIAANYIGGFLNNQTPTVAGVRVPEYQVPSWTTWDLNLSYEPDLQEGIFGGTRISLNVRNFTDKDAPVVLTNNSAADLSNHNVFGQIWSLELAKRF